MYSLSELQPLESDADGSAPKTYSCNILKQLFLKQLFHK